MEIKQSSGRPKCDFHRWERDADLTVKDLHTFDLAAVALDALCYFVVGRWWQKPGADRASVLVPALAGIYVFSAVGGRWHYSISLFSIKCLWPPSLVAAALLIVGVVVVFVVLHAVAFYRDGVLLGRCVEVAATAMIFVLPVCRNSSFHVHHWYWTWLIGMHANRDCWWSTAAGAFLWGGYINGIARRGAGRVSIRPESSLSAQAAWGRDDVLGCERSLYGAVDQGCPFVSTRRVAAVDVSAPDWRTCSPAPR